MKGFHQLLCADVFNFLGFPVNAGIIDEDIQFTKIFNGFGDYFFAVVFSAKIAFDEDAFSTQLLNLLFGFLCIGSFTQVRNNNISTFRSKKQGSSFPNATVATCDDGGFAF